jgi:hypothetical protein
MKLIKNVAMVVLIIIFFIGLTILYNVLDPDGYMSKLEDGYWAGYYETRIFGKVWCLAKFYNDRNETKILVLSVAETKDLYSVERNSSDKDFIRYKMKSKDSGLQIEAKQLYVGRRYLWGRLLVGRFRDFWKINEEDSIRGYFVYPNDKPKFEIERLSRDRLVDFYNKLVLGENKYSNPDAIDALIAQSIGQTPI